MGQHGSKSSIEARVLFQRVGAPDKRYSMYQEINASSTPASTIRFQQKVISRLAIPHSPGRTLEKTRPHFWDHSRRDTGGLEYVMDNPTGGVWVKPREKWRRS